MILLKSIQEKDISVKDIYDKIYNIKVKKISVVKETFKTYDAQEGNNRHISANLIANIPTKYLLELQGVMGEKRDLWINPKGDFMFGNYTLKEWYEFLLDIAKNGIQYEVFVTVDYGDKPKVNEGNHRIKAANMLRLKTVPCEVRFFGKAEENFISPYRNMDDAIKEKIEKLK